MKQQRGFIGALTLVFFILSALAYVYKDAWKFSDPILDKQRHNSRVLQQAKDALLEYVVSNDPNYESFAGVHRGRLPCAAQLGNGQEFNSPTLDNGSVCSTGSIDSLGLFPWAITNKVIRDSASECLWYIVASTHKNSPSLNSVNKKTNADTAGKFTIKKPIKNINGEWELLDITKAGEVVAAIIAPGEILHNTDNNQVRNTAEITTPCALNTSAAPFAKNSAVNYLDMLKINALDPNNNPVTNTYSNFLATNNVLLQFDLNREAINDEIIWITAEEYGAAASKRAALFLSRKIQDFVFGNLLLGYRGNASPTSASNGYGVYPYAAEYPGGDCKSGLYFGFVPKKCNDTDIIPASWQQADDAGERWLSQAYYYVAKDCAMRSNAVVAADAATRENPCRASTSSSGINYLNIQNERSVQALLIMRGRATLPIKCAVSPTVFNTKCESEKASITTAATPCNGAYLWLCIDNPPFDNKAGTNQVHALRFMDATFRTNPDAAPIYDLDEYKNDLFTGPKSITKAAGNNNIIVLMRQR